MKNWIWLSQCINYKSIQVVLDRFETPEAIFLAEETELLRYLSRYEVSKILKRDFSIAERILNDCYQKDISTIAISDSAYPSILANIENPPLV